MNAPGKSHPSSEEPGAWAAVPGSHPATNDVAAGKPGTKQAKFRLRKVLMVVVPAAVLAVLVAAMAGLIDTDALLANLTRPALAPAGGQVLFQGQPLRNGQIATLPRAGRGLPALGWTDDEGKFTLQTDIRGKFVDGATVGEHQVVVIAYSPNSGAAAPTLLTPQLYASAGTSPLRITIGRKPEENQFTFTLEGDAPSRPERAALGGNKGKSKRSKSKAKEDSSEAQ